MRTSNKIILGIFVAPLLIIASVHIALYAKYKSGNYVMMKTAKEDRFVRFPLKNIRRVHVMGLNNVNIITSDTARIEYEKGNEAFQYTVTGDSLYVHGETVVNAGNHQEMDRGYQLVNIYLPGASISADNASIALSGSTDSLKAPSYTIYLTPGADFRAQYQGRGDDTRTYFNNLVVEASRAGSLNLAEFVHIASMTLNVTESEFNDNKATIENLQLKADDKSTIILNSRNLKRTHTVQ